MKDWRDCSRSSKVIEKYPELGMIFQRIMIAYQCNDYKELKELEVLTSKALDDIGEEKFEVVIPDIESKIEELEEENKSLKKQLDDKCDKCIKRDKAEGAKEFKQFLDNVICENTYPYFDKDGKPVNIWKVTGFDKIDGLLKEYLEGL